MNYPLINSVFSITNNSCANVTTLESGQNCTFILNYTPGLTAGVESYNVGYSDGVSSVSQVAGIVIPYSSTVVTLSPKFANSAIMGYNFQFEATLTSGTTTTVTTTFNSQVMGAFNCF